VKFLCQWPARIDRIGAAPYQRAAMANVIRPAALGLACCLLAMAALADPAAEDISVTGGSRPVGDSGADPVTTIDSGTIARSGATSLEELLEQIPALGAQGVNSSQNAGGYGENFVDLRNLNFDRTVVLVDGSRFVASGIKTDEAVDLGNIPVSLVDHIDIYRDGVQPQFAADSVAGVVNVVLKTHVQGVRMDVYGGLAGAGDAATQSASLVAGRDFSNGFMTVSLGASDRQAIPQRDRGWAAGPITEATFAPGGGVDVLTGSPAVPGGQAIGPGVDALLLGGGRYRDFNPRTDQYDFAADQDLQGGQTRVTASINGEYDFFDGVTGFIDAIGAYRRAQDLLPPAMLGLNGTAKHPQGFVVPADNAYNPFGQAVDLERAVTEAGDQTITTIGPTWRIVSGVKGVADGVDWRISVNHGQGDTVYATSNEIDLTRALDTLSPSLCAAQPGCVAADWFGPDSLSPRALAYVGYTDRSHSAYAEDIVQADIRGDLGNLPGGRAQVSGGLAWRREAGMTSVSAVTQAGDQSGPDAAPTSGGYETAEAYGDVFLPVLRGLPFAHALTVDFAVRGEATSRFGNIPSAKETLRYAAVSDIAFRATHGTGGRPPAISEAFAGTYANFLPVTDPCDAGSGLRANAVVNANCLAQGLGPGFRQNSALIDVPGGGNPGLHAERSENASLGAVLTPHDMSWMTASVDWWQYRIKHAIDSLADTDPNLIGNACYESAGLSSPLCSFITRAPGGANAGQISEIYAPDENVGTIKTSGIDMDFSARREVTGGFTVAVDWQGSWLLDWRIHDVGTPGFTQYAGYFPGLSGVGLYPRLRARLETTLDFADWSLGWTTRYMSGGHVLGAEGTPYSQAAQVFYQDVSISRRLGRFGFLAGIDNITNRSPPLLVDGVTNTDTNSYDTAGIFLWARLTANFR
jgi:iron complex outermembrane receptor protein